LDYTYGLNEGMYTPEEITQAQSSPSFSREMEIKFLGMIGNSFSTSWIAQATSFQYDPDFINPDSTRVISCDPALGGSSNFGILVTEYRDGRIAVLLAEEHSKETAEDMADYVSFLYHKFYPVRKIYFDGSQIAWGQSLIKRLPELRQNPNYQADID